MKKKEKRMIIMLIIVGVVVIGGLLIWGNRSKKEGEVVGGEVEETNQEEYVQELEDGSKLNISEKLHEEKELGELRITNIQLREIGGITTLLADVENKSGEISESKMVEVEVIDKEGNIIITLKGVIDEMEEGETSQLNVSVTSDIANAYDFRISEE